MTLASTAKLLELIEDHPLYDLALEEAVGCIPPQLSDNDSVSIGAVRQYMCALFMRGYQLGFEMAQREKY